jgi:SAM dependent carboxyl methyltransferase
MADSGPFISLAGPRDVREAFERQAADDWKFFLSLRAKELRAGGRLVVVLPGLNDEGLTGFEPLFSHAKSALAEMVAEGTITDDECARMVRGTYPRRKCELLAPFGADGQFLGLTVEHCEHFGLPDAAWTEYERDAKGASGQPPRGILPFHLRPLPSVCSHQLRERTGLRRCHGPS